MNHNSHKLLEAATNYLQEQRSYSVSQLQQKFKLGYSDALGLQKELADQKVIEEPNPLGLFHVSVQHLSHSIEIKDALYVHAIILRNLALYLIEHDGFHSTICLKILTQPYPYERNHQELRALTRECIAANENPLLALTLRLSRTPAMAGKFAPELVEKSIAELCSQSQVSVQMPDRSDKYEMRLNGLRHAIRYLHRRLEEDIDSHSRVFEAFIHDDLLPSIKALNLTPGEATQREHVVPCAFLKNKAIKLLSKGILQEDVVQWVEPFIRIVLIPKKDACALDGPMKLKDTMPIDWLFGEGCMYERLHLRNISLDLSDANEPCTCTCAE